MQNKLNGKGQKDLRSSAGSVHRCKVAHAKATRSIRNWESQM